MTFYFSHLRLGNKLAGIWNDLERSSVRPNQNGNTGRYNMPDRSGDQNYSDEF